MESQPRRSFLTSLTGAVVGLGAVVAGWPFFRSLVPNVLYEPPKRFKIGAPEDFQQGVTFIDKHRIYLFKEVSRYQKAPDSFPMVYDIASNTWLDVKPTNQPPADRRRAHSTASLAHYDSVSDVVVFFQLHGRRPEDRGVRIYSPANSAWASGSTAFPPDWNGRAACNAFYHPRLNAHFIHQAGDSRGNGVIRVYRHRRAAGPAKAAGD